MLIGKELPTPSPQGGDSRPARPAIRFDVWKHVPPAEAIGRNIRRCREERGISIEALGMRIGMSDSNVWRWEVGAAYPRMDHIFALAKALNCDPADLIKIEA